VLSGVDGICCEGYVSLSTFDNATFQKKLPMLFTKAVAALQGESTKVHKFAMKALEDVLPSAITASTVLRSDRIHPTY